MLKLLLTTTFFISLIVVSFFFFDPVNISVSIKSRKLFDIDYTNKLENSELRCGKNKSSNQKSCQFIIYGNSIDNLHENSKTSQIPAIVDQIFYNDGKFENTTDIICLSSNSTSQDDFLSNESTYKVNQQSNFPNFDITSPIINISVLCNGTHYTTKIKNDVLSNKHLYYIAYYYLKNNDFESFAKNMKTRSSKEDWPLPTTNVASSSEICSNYNDNLFQYLSMLKFSEEKYEADIGSPPRTVEDLLNFIDTTNSNDIPHWKLHLNMFNVGSQFFKSPMNKSHIALYAILTFPNSESCKKLCSQTLLTPRSDPPFYPVSCLIREDIPNSISILFRISILKL